MGTKYIIEVEDKPFELLSENGFTSEKLFRVKGFNSLVFDWNGLNMLTPYTEPDTEQVRKEAYENGYENGFIAGHLKAEKSGQSFYEDGYKRGLADAWEAARKIGSNSMCSLKEMGFDFSQCAVDDYNPSWFVVKNYSASEAIEKIRQYEQEKEEPKKEQSFTAEEVMRQYLDTFCKRHFCSTCPLHTSEFTCGRGYHFTTKNPISNEEVRRAYAKVLQHEEVG